MTEEERERERERKEERGRVHSDIEAVEPSGRHGGPSKPFFPFICTCCIFPRF